MWRWQAAAWQARDATAPPCRCGQPHTPATKDGPATARPAPGARTNRRRRTIRLARQHGLVRGQKLGAAEVLPLRVDAGGEVRLVFGIAYPLRVVGHKQGVVAKGGEPAVQANGKVLQI